MLHNGDTVMMPWGYYDLENVLIDPEGQSWWENHIAMVDLAVKIQDQVQSESWPFDEAEMKMYASTLKTSPAYSSISQASIDKTILKAYAERAADFISEYVSGRNEGLRFKLTEHGYWAIVPDHDCVALDAVCPADPDPKSTYGLSDEQLAALQGGAQ